MRFVINYSGTASGWMDFTDGYFGTIRDSFWNLGWRLWDNYNFLVAMAPVELWRIFGDNTGEFWGIWDGVFEIIVTF